MERFKSLAGPRIEGDNMKKLVALSFVCGLFCYANSFGPGQSGVGARSAPSSGGAGSGISSLNALTESIQTMEVGTSGSDFAISSSGSTHTFNLPTASGSVRGALSSSDWTTFNSKLNAANPSWTGTMATPLTAGRVLITDGSGNMSVSSVTSTTLGYLDVGSSLTTLLAAKEPSITTLSIAKGGTNSGTSLNNNRIMRSSSGSIVEASAITANRALISDANGIPTHSSVTSTELGYVSGVTSAVQTQMDALKVNSFSGHIESPSAKTYVLDQYAEFAYTINRITIDMSAGTATAKLTIDGVDVTGCTSISASTTESTTSCTAANSVSAGNTVALVITSPSSAADLSFTMKYTR